MKLLKKTPMIKQYLSIKEKYADTILFYRMGDFYEMFFEDAEVASKALEITLTSRNKKDEFPIPMCGVPYKAAQGYLARLIDQGYKVAICDQVEDPALAKGLVKREVVRVITPGMILDNELLDEKSDNYVLALARNDDTAGLSYLDISTGIFRVTESRDMNSIVDEALRISPSEVLLPESSKNERFFSPILNAMADRSITFISDTEFKFGRGRERLVDQFKTLSLEGFGCEHLEAGVRAAGALLFYIRETQKQKIEHLSGIESYSLSNYLIVDDISSRNLEIIKNILTGSRQGTLLGIMDRTVTAMGGRLLKRWIRYPLMDVPEIESRQHAVGEVKNERRHWPIITLPILAGVHMHIGETGHQICAFAVDDRHVRGYRHIFSRTDSNNSRLLNQDRLILQDDLSRHRNQVDMHKCGNTPLICT